MQKIIVILLMISYIYPGLSLASDSDTEPYLIYIDPVTGKYTKQPPAHTEAAETVLTVQRPAQPVSYTHPALVLVVSGSMLFLGHLIAVLYSRRSAD